MIRELGIYLLLGSQKQPPEIIRIISMYSIPQPFEIKKTSLVGAAFAHTFQRTILLRMPKTSPTVAG